MNPFRRKAAKQLTPHNHEVISPEEAAAAPIDVEISRIVDSYSRLGESQYVRTKTYRYPDSARIPGDSSLQRRIYVLQKGNSMGVLVLGSEEAGQGGRRYLITPGDEGNMDVAVSDFIPRDNLKGLLLEAPQGGVLKEVVDDKAGTLGATESGVDWLEQTGLLTDDQRMQMDMVGFALETIEPHLAPGSSLRVLR